MFLCVMLFIVVDSYLVFVKHFQVTSLHIIMINQSTIEYLKLNYSLIDWSALVTRSFQLSLHFLKTMKGHSGVDCSY